MRIKSKLISSILAVVACCTFVNLSTFAADAATIALNGTKDPINPGDEFTVEFEVANNPGIISLFADVTWGDDLTLTAVNDTGIFPGKNHSATLKKPYRLNWSDDLATDNYTTNGVYATLTFKLSESATDDGEIGLSLIQDSTLDTDFGEVAFTPIRYTYTVAKGSTEPEKPVNGDEIGTTNGKKIYYANTVSGTFNKNTGFVVKYTGDDATYKGKYEGDCKDIKATLGDLLGGKIGEGSVTGNLHFGIVLKDTSLEAATIPGFQVETK